MLKSVKIRQATKEGTVIWNVGGVGLYGASIQSRVDTAGRFK